MSTRFSFCRAGELFLTIAEESQGKWNVDSAGDGILDVPTQTSTKSDAASPYNAAPMPDLSKFSDIDIRTQEMLAAQAPTRASIAPPDTNTSTVNTPKSISAQSNGGGGDLDAPQQTTTQTSVDPELADVIEAATAAVEGRRPVLSPKSPQSTAEPTMAELIEITNAAIEGRKPNLPVESSTAFGVDFPKTKGYNGDNDIGDAIETVEAEVKQQQQNVNNVANLPRIKCIRQDLAGKRHPDTGVLYTERIVTIDGQQYIVVAPEFDSMFDAQLPDELRYARDKKQFKECTLQLWSAIQENSQLKAMFTDEQLWQISQGITPDDFTWHHDVEVGKMQLVLTEIHSNTRHTGGRSLWGGGKKYR